MSSRIGFFEMSNYGLRERLRTLLCDGAHLKNRAAPGELHDQVFVPFLEQFGRQQIDFIDDEPPRRGRQLLGKIAELGRNCRHRFGRIHVLVKRSDVHEVQ